MLPARPLRLPARTTRAPRPPPTAHALVRRARQVSDQCVEMASKSVFKQSKTDPRVAKSADDCCFLVEKKEQVRASPPDVAVVCSDRPTACVNLQ